MPQGSDTTITLAIIPDKAKYLAPVSELFLRVALLRIETVEDSRRAQELLIEVRTRKNSTLAPIEEMVASANATHKKSTALRNAVQAPFDLAETRINQELDSHEREQRRIAEAEQSRLQALARQQEEERQLQDAIQAEADGDTQAVEEILAEPVVAPVVRVAAAVAKVAGVSQTKRYGCELVSVAELVAWIAGVPVDQIPLDWLAYLEPARLAETHPNLNAAARMQREVFAVPGCRLVTETTRGVKT